jgi:branched-chain amino acid transport system ATP-binding protein
MLTATDLHAFYGRAHILHGVSLALGAGEVLVLLGRNGAGKSTTMKALIGLVRPRAGHVAFAGQQVAGWEPYRIARLGLGYVPEDRRIFADLSVAENLEVGRQPARDGIAPWTEARLLALFPNLARMRDRAGGRMSGGEQQMLAIARTLMGNPRAVLLDEQNLYFAARVADRAAVIEGGLIAWQGAMRDLLADETLRRTHLQV